MSVTVLLPPMSSSDVNNNNISQSIVEFYTDKKQWYELFVYYWELGQKNPENPDIMYHLAQCFEKGIGVAKQIEEAYRFYKQAALRGHTLSTKCIGRMYNNGDFSTVKQIEKQCLDVVDQCDEKELMKLRAKIKKQAEQSTWIQKHQ